MDKIFKKQLWISGGVILGTIIIGSAALYVLAGNLAALSLSIASHRTIMSSQVAAVETFADLKKNASIAANYQNAIDKLLTSQDGLIAFSQQIDSLGRADGVSTNFSFQGGVLPAVANSPGSVGFTLDVTGPAARVSTFMEDFESKSPILLSQLSTANLTGDGTTYTLSAQGNVFFK